jgi:hypothetical protein
MAIATEFFQVAYIALIALNIAEERANKLQLGKGKAKS